ncbi:unnamed protein product, partial [marine sediment metagenome]
IIGNICHSNIPCFGGQKGYGKTLTEPPGQTIGDTPHSQGSNKRGNPEFSYQDSVNKTWNKS